MMVEIRKATEADWEDVWPIVHEVFSRGDTYPYSPDTGEEDAYEIWMKTPFSTYIALENGKVLGTYYIKPNQPALGSHVCNAGYMVSSVARGKGIGRAMCKHSLQEARKLGFKAMQFNLVVSTNVNAIRLWRNMGFEVIGILTKAFKHPEKGMVDALVMYQWLNEET